ncbi:MAG: hypothetical protein WKG07_11795 [Hymenobacter sp.]
MMALPVTSLAEDKEWKAYFTRHRIAVRYCPAASLSYQTVGDGAAFRQAAPALDFGPPGLGAGPRPAHAGAGPAARQPGAARFCL